MNARRAPCASMACRQPAAKKVGNRLPPPGRLGAETMTGGLPAYLAMGGYAAFVWPAYGIAAAVLGGLAIYWWRRLRARAAARARLRRRAAIRGCPGRAGGRCRAGAMPAPPINR